MLSVALIYGLLPVDLQAAAAVPRLNAELLTLLDAAHPDWDLSAISPEARPVPGVDTVGVTLSVRTRVKLRLLETWKGRRLYKPTWGLQSYRHSLWAEAASARLAASLDRPSTVVICIHAERQRRGLPAGGARDDGLRPACYRQPSRRPSRGHRRRCHRSAGRSPNAVDCWVEAIAGLLTDAEARATLGTAARAAVLRRFTPERAQQDWSRVLTQLGSE